MVPVAPGVIDQVVYAVAQQKAMLSSVIALSDDVIIIVDPVGLG